MRRHAKASSAFTNGHGGSVNGRDAHSFATRGVSRDVAGSGAPSNGRTRLGLAVLATAALALLALAPLAQASKTVHSYFGNTGSTPSGNAIDGGLFNTPRGVAVNVAGTGGATAGDIYVVNSSANRVDQFSASGTFIRAFGRDVIEEGKANDNATGFEICDTTAGNVAADCKAGVNAPAEGGTLSSPQGIAVNQTSGHLYVTNQSLIRVDEFDATGHFVRAFGQDVVSAGPDNVAAAAAKQTLSVDATEGQLKLSFRGQTTADIAFNASAAEVDAALEALSTVGAANVAVSGGPGGAGGGTPYVITFAGALTNAPMPLIGTAAGTTPLGGGAGASVLNTTTGASGYEICNAGVDTCKTGVTASSAGAFKSTFNGHPAVAPVGAPNAGNVVVADPANLRVNEYSSSGAFVRSFGFDVSASPPVNTGFEICDAANFDVCKIGIAGAGAGQFALDAVNRVAVDSTGAIYAVESLVNFRVQKFSPAGPSLTPAVFAGGVLTGTSSSGATQDNPTDVAIGAADKVFVTKVFPAGAGTPAATVQERRVLELDSTGALVDTHIANAAINAGNGLAANPANGRLYVSTSTTPHRVYVLADALAPSATVAASDDVGDTGATFHGTVNPGGVLGTYHFEYVDDAQFQIDGWASAQSLPDTDAGNGNTPVSVSRDVDDLASSTPYHVRLVIKQTFGEATAVSVGTAGNFTTGAAKPIVGPIGDADAATSAATLYGHVVPNGQATSYRFEWGPTSAYGNSTSLTAAGSGIDGVFAHAEITGLQPSTTYYFRLVATSTSGTTEGEDHVFSTETVSPAICPNQQFRQGVGASLPDCRAYEQVSPVDKNGYDIAGADTIDGPAPKPVSLSGDTAMFVSRGSFAGNPGGGPALGPYSQYVSRRSNGQWNSRAITPRSTSTTAERDVVLASSDLSTFFLRALGHSFEPDPPPPPSFSGFYFRDPFAGETTQLYEAPENSSVFLAGTPDLSHIAFTSATDFLDDPSIPDTGLKAWEATQGEIRLVSRQPISGDPFEPATVAGLAEGGGFGTGGGAMGARAISSDGSKIFFETPGSLGGPSGDTALIYRRSNGASTELVSPSHRTPTDPLGQRQKQFRMATSDGDSVFFTSSEMLTDDANTGPTRAGSDLYRYDIEADELIDISSTPGGDGARVRNVVGSSESGDRVYYVALGQVVPGEGIAGQPNLYLWEEDGSTAGATRFIATLNSDDKLVWSTGGGRLSRVTADGRYLVLQSKESLTGYPNAATTQIFHYDADADAGQGELVCASCNPSGNPPAGPSSMPNGALYPRWISEDGRYVFFDSEDALVAGDTNGVRDAYVWSNGQVSLLSSGTSSGQSRFFSASADGREGFFVTRERLVPQDIDFNIDLYAASVDGGLASQFPVTPPSCNGEECRGANSQAPVSQPALTSSFSGAGNAKPAKPRCAKGKRMVRTRSGKTRCVKKSAGRGKNRGRANQNRRASR